jgi:hypothetical protein
LTFVCKTVRTTCSHIFLSLSLCTYYIYIHIYIYIRLREIKPPRIERIERNIHTYIHTYIHTCIYIRVCMLINNQHACIHVCTYVLDSSTYTCVHSHWCPEHAICIDINDMSIPTCLRHVCHVTTSLVHRKL